MNLKLVACVSTLVVITGPAHANDWYIGGSIGLNSQSDSDNGGQTGAFTTGNIGDGTTIPVAAGTDYGWTTEFDNGTALTGEFGKRYENGFRAGVEVFYTGADVDTHKNVTLGGGAIGTLDAAALASSPTALGVDIATLVADGRGEVTTTGIMLNGYYDFDLGNAIQPYVGFGIGYADVDVDYSPSGVGIIDDGEGKFAYQLKLGGTLLTEGPWEFYSEYTYRATDDIDVTNSLFPGSLSIENQQNLFAVGVRYALDS